MSPVLEFNRYNRKRLVIDDPQAASIEIGGVFDADNVDAFARLLQAGFQLEARAQGNEIHVRRPAA
jgi:transmembrane sensor